MSSRDNNIKIRTNSALASHVRTCASKEGISVSRYVRRLVKTMIKQTDNNIPCLPCEELSITSFAERQDLAQLSATMSVPMSHVVNMAIFMDMVNKTKKPA